MEQILQVFFNAAILERAWPFLMRGVTMTALLSLVVVPIGLASGLAVAMLYHLHRKWLSRFLIAYVDFFRAFPPLVLLLFIYGGLPFLGIDLPLRISGNHENTPGCTVLGPRGAIQLTKGVIRAERHVHMSTQDMAYYGVKDADYMKLRIDGPCGVLFDRVKVRYHPKVVLEVHIDTDEGNACDLETATYMELIK